MALYETVVLPRGISPNEDPLLNEEELFELTKTTWNLAKSQAESLGLTLSEVKKPNRSRVESSLVFTASNVSGSKSGSRSGISGGIIQSNVQNADDSLAFSASRVSGNTDIFSRSKSELSKTGGSRLRKSSLKRSGSQQRGN